MTVRGLAESARDLRTREDLAAFLCLAAEDVMTNPEEWGNDSLHAFIEGWSAWLNDCPGWFARNGQEVPELPSWKFIGEMVMAARVYE